MSQHLFKTTYQNRPIEVMLGWDRPLQGFYMVIDRLDAKRDEPETLYCNLDDETLERADGLANSLDHFICKLKELQIQVPEQMISAVSDDGKNNVGNKRVDYSR